MFLKVKLSPKSDSGFLCNLIWVKPLCKSIITMKETLSRFTVILFLGKLIFNGGQGHFYTSIKIIIFKIQRRLDTTWNFAHNITRVSTHEHEHWEHCLCTQSLLKRRLHLSAVTEIQEHSTLHILSPWLFFILGKELTVYNSFIQGQLLCCCKTKLKLVQQTVLGLTLLNLVKCLLFKNGLQAKYWEFIG